MFRRKDINFVKQLLNITQDIDFDHYPPARMVRHRSRILELLEWKPFNAGVAQRLYQRRTCGGESNKQTYQRKSVRFTLDEFDKVIQSIVASTKVNLPINPEDYYPSIKPKGGKTRKLPIIDPGLINAIQDYLDLRLQTSILKPNAPLLLSQKGGAYSPNTLQDHMRMMMREWANIDRASSHSGRCTLATKLLHDQKEHLKTVQQILGHKDAATTTIYHELPESEVRNVLNTASKTYNK